MSPKFKKINRKKGIVEQNHLYVTYSNFCQCSCPGCRNLGFSDKVMMEYPKLLDERILENSKYFRHIIFGGGEPAYRIPEIVKLIEKIKEKNLQREGMPEDKKIKFTMTTNGSRLLLSRLDDVCRNCNKFDRIILSRYHYDDCLNDALFKANGSLMTTHDIDDLCDTLKKKIQLSCLCQHGGIESVDEMERYVLWAHHLGIKDIMFSNFQKDVTPVDSIRKDTTNVFKDAKERLMGRGFTKVDELVFSAGYKIEVFEKSELDIYEEELKIILEMIFGIHFGGEEKKSIKVSFREFSQGGEQSEEWNTARKRTWNYSIMPNGELFSDLSCKKEI